MTEQLILYDLTSKDGFGKCFSWNTWRARLALNYKGVPYKTTWIEYVDVEPTFSPLGIVPNTPAPFETPYTLPILKHPTEGYIMQTYAIAKKLDELYPEPSLQLDNGSYERAHAAIHRFQSSLVPELVPRIPSVLTDKSFDYFVRTRSEWVGAPLAELLKSDKAGEAAWAAAEPAMQGLKALLTENSSGPYINGEKAGYADLVVASTYASMKVVHEESFKRWMAWDECFQKHYDACRQWTERDSY